MKLTGQIQGTGKIGTIVVSKVGGESIARQYNPNVSNPNTEAQVAQRAALKLASQLSSALASSIVMKKEGLVSARNKFVKRNIALISVSNGVAQISYENIQLTEGNNGLPSISVIRANSKITFALTEAAAMNISRVIYEVYKKSGDGQLMKMQSLVVSAAGDGRTFPSEVNDIAGDVVVWAYGMIDTNADATSKFGNYNVQSGTDIARLYSTRSLNAADYTFTQTRGVTLFSGSSETVVVPEGSHTVYITAGSHGTVAGTGFTNGRKVVAEGENVTITATPGENATFDGWYINGNPQTLVSQNAEYTFAMGQNNVDLIALFNYTNPDDDDPEGDEH